MKKRTGAKPPSTVGETLRTEFMLPGHINMRELALRLSVNRNTVSALVHGKSRLSTIMAFKLAKAFRTTPGFWLNIQINRDSWEQEQKV